MGLLVDGQWQDKWYDTGSHGGRFVRETAGFRNWITEPGTGSDRSAGPFEAEPGRYHLYVAWPCPWSHRVILYHRLLGLESVISLSAVNPLMLDHGWEFGGPGEEREDPFYGSRYLYQIYSRADAHYTGRVTVPVVWDRKTETIVNNESSEIMRMLSAFKSWASHWDDYYPEALRSEIDEINEEIYVNVNNGVYKAGFSTSQQAYEEAYDALFATLDRLERRLSQRRYLCGSVITEADWRLFVTLVRFDAVYFGHFKCNRKRIADYPNLAAYLRDLYQQPRVSETVRIGESKLHYYGSHRTINPTGIIPKGPELSFDEPHGREALS